MTEAMNVLWIVMSVIIGLMHIISSILCGRLEKIISYIALFLHIPTLIFLLLAKAKIETVAIVITLSLLIYIVANTLIPFIKKQLNAGAAAPSESREEGESYDL